MKMKYKVLLLILGISLALSLALGSSYAMWMSTISQSGQNVVSTDCLNITLAGQNDISLTNSFPITDSEAQDLEPYTFTITNKCNLVTDYVVNIETLNKSTLDLSFIKYSLDNNINVLGSIENNDSSSFINSNVLSSKTIATGSLKAGASKTYNLKFWIDESATSSDVELKTFASKIAVSARTGKNYIILDAKGGQVEGKYLFLKDNKLESLPTPIKDGYEFQGWFSMDGSGYQIDTSSTLNPGDTIYARWENKTFNLTYDLDGGSVSDNPTSYTKESNITLNAPTKSGYTFSGWEERIVNLTWYKGFVDINNGSLRMSTTYTTSEYSNLIRLRKGESIEITNLNGYLAGSLRIRAYNMDGSYLGNTSGRTYTPSSDVFIRVMFVTAPTQTQRESLYIKINNVKTVKEIKSPTTGNRHFVAKYTAN